MLFSPSTDCVGPTHIGQSSLFQSAHGNVNLIQEQLHRHTQNGLGFFVCCFFKILFTYS